MNEQNLMRQLRTRAAETKSGSYLFWGLDGMGKFAAAFSFVKALECETFSACSRCQFCAAVDKKIHPDVLVIAPLLGNEEEEPVERREIGIGEVRNIKRFLSFFPHQGRSKAVIVNNAERLTEEAQNSFLKILEEPTGAAVLILVTSQPGRLLGTIRSRLFPVPFDPWSEERIRQLLKQEGANEETARAIAKMSCGRPAFAKEMVLNPARWDRVNSEADAFFDVVEQGMAERFLFVEGRIKAENKAGDFLHTALLVFRDVLLVKLGLDNLAVHARHGEDLKKTARRYEVGKIAEILRSISETRNILNHTNASPRLALEHLMLNL